MQGPISVFFCWLLSAVTQRRQGATLVSRLPRHAALGHGGSRRLSLETAMSLGRTAKHASKLCRQHMHCFLLVWVNAEVAPLHQRHGTALLCTHGTSGAVLCRSGCMLRWRTGREAPCTPADGRCTSLPSRRLPMASEAACQQQRLTVTWQQLLPSRRPTASEAAAACSPGACC